MVLDLFSGLDMRANRMSIQENAEALFRVPRRSKLLGHNSFLVACQRPLLAAHGENDSI
jgi:hypothetical protein